MKYFKKFNNESEYNSFKNSPEYVEPNVSYCVNEDEVHFTPIIQVADTHEYVDLGLPSGTLWATENIKDANGNDLYFAWGETQGYTAEQIGTDKNFTWEDYKYGAFDSSDKENYGMTKYNGTDGKTVLDPEDDAATANWGSNWRMPTAEEFNELNSNPLCVDCYNDDTEGGVWVYEQGELTIPSCGYAENGVVKKYTSNEFKPLTWISKKSLLIANYIESRDGYMAIGGFERCIGLPVRPVRANS